MCVKRAGQFHRATDAKATKPRLLTSQEVYIQDDTEDLRRRRLVEINSTIESNDVMAERKRLEAQHGQIWDATQLAKDFDVLGFMAPYVVVRRKSDERKGSLEFQHLPRFYFNFVLD
jgi:hypothetical protein